MKTKTGGTKISKAKVRARIKELQASRKAGATAELERKGFVEKYERCSNCSGTGWIKKEK